MTTGVSHTPSQPKFVRFLSNLGESRAQVWRKCSKKIGLKFGVLQVPEVGEGGWGYVQYQVIQNRSDFNQNFDKAAAKHCKNTRKEIGPKIELLGDLDGDEGGMNQEPAKMLLQHLQITSDCRKNWPLHRPSTRDHERCQKWGRYCWLTVEVGWGGSWEGETHVGPEIWSK